MIEGVKQKSGDLEAQLPADVKLEIIRDQSRYIYEALHEIKRHLVLGSILACLVVLLFMRNWRATVIAAVAIPDLGHRHVRHDEGAAISRSTA